MKSKVKTLKPIGNSLGLIIERPILDLLGIGRDTPLRLSTDGRRLYVEPADVDGQEQAGNATTDAGVPG
jgi:hypothetical protein